MRRTANPAASLARRLGPWLLAAGCPALSATAQAVWDVVPEITLQAETTDNPALADGAAAPPAVEKTSRGLADALVALRRVAPRGELLLEPRVRADAYAEAETEHLESTDVFLRSSGSRRARIVRIGYAADVADERVLGVEFLETLPDDPDVDDPTDIATSRRGLNGRRTRVGLAPFLEIALNTRSEVRLEGRVFDVDYERDIALGSSDFSERAFGGKYRRALDDTRSHLGIGLTGTRFEAPFNDNVTVTTGIELSFERTMSDAWSWSIAGGTQRAEFELTNVDQRVVGTDDTGTFALGVQRQGEVTQLRFRLAHAMGPDAFGFVAVRNELRLAWDRRLSARLDGRIVLRALDTEGASVAAANGYRYGRLELDLGWRLRGPWSLLVGYSRAVDEPELVDAAASNTLIVGVRYRGRAAHPAVESP